MPYYCTVHRDEDQQKLQGQKLDAGNTHMVFDSGYDLASMRQWVGFKPYLVIWEMERCAEAKFGYTFKTLVGIPH